MTPKEVARGLMLSGVAVLVWDTLSLKMRKSLISLALKAITEASEEMVKGRKKNE